MEPHVRARISLNTVKEVTDFVSIINSDGTADRYIVENFQGNERVSARSLLGMMYASGEFAGETYLVNETNDGVFPYQIDKYRI